MKIQRFFERYLKGVLKELNMKYEPWKELFRTSTSNGHP